MAFQQKINVMDFAKKEGKQRRIADVLQDLASQQAGIPGEMAEYSSDKGMLDLGSSMLVNYGIDALLGLATGGATTGFSFLKKLFGTGAVGEVGKEGFKAAIEPTILNKLLGMGAKGAGKYSLSGGLSNLLGKQFKIKPPEAPTVDMSKLTGPGMSGARRTIQDALEVSGGDVSSLIEGDEGSRKMMNFLMSFGPELKDPLKESGVTIMDIFRKQLGLSPIPKY